MTDGPPPVQELNAKNKDLTLKGPLYDGSPLPVIEKKNQYTSKEE